MSEDSNDFLSRVPDEDGALGVCPFTVDRVAMWHRWDQPTFLHWPYQPELVQSLLPRGLTVETYDHKALVHESVDLTGGDE